MSDSTKPQGWPWPAWMGQFPDPFGLLAPKALSQPILPGWMLGNTISVTENNSSAPDTERDIVAAESYGRQLGRILDALSVLIDERPKSAADEKPLEELLELRKKIEQVKTRAAARRLKRVRADLAHLREADPEEYARLARALGDVLR